MPYKDPVIARQKAKEYQTKYRLQKRLAKVNSTSSQNVKTKDIVIEQEVAPLTIAEKDVCFLCLKDCDEKMKTCCHFLHKQCKKDLVKRNFVSCGICSVPFKHITPKKVKDRKYEKLVNDIINKLSIHTYDYEDIVAIANYLED